MNKDLIRRTLKQNLDQINEEIAQYGHLSAREYLELKKAELIIQSQSLLQEDEKPFYLPGCITLIKPDPALPKETLENLRNSFREMGMKMRINICEAPEDKPSVLMDPTRCSGMEPDFEWLKNIRCPDFKPVSIPEGMLGKERTGATAHRKSDDAMESLSRIVTLINGKNKS